MTVPATAHAALAEMASLLQRVITWQARVDADGEDCEYVNGEDGDAWDDMRAIVGDACVALTKAGILP